MKAYRYHFEERERVTTIEQNRKINNSVSKKSFPILGASIVFFQLYYVV